MGQEMIEMTSFAAKKAVTENPKATEFQIPREDSNWYKYKKMGPSIEGTVNHFYENTSGNGLNFIFLLRLS